MHFEATHIGTGCQCRQWLIYCLYFLLFACIVLRKAETVYKVTDLKFNVESRDISAKAILFTILVVCIGSQR